jgi:riboflavin kinase / FMN adenylyltransferase
MKLARLTNDIPFDKNSTLTVGTFDGVHLAHQKIIKEVVALARKRNGRSVVMTFEPHPREVVGASGTPIQLLTTLRERQEMCEQLGVDWFVVIRFDKELSNQSFRDFYIRYLINGIGMNQVVEGYDHHWGKNREGTIDSLLDLGREFGFDVVNIDQFLFHGQPISSSVIRNELSQGKVEYAAELLGRPYAINGTVVEGDKRGRSLGYPTANIELDSPKKLVPANGIYLVKVTLRNEKYFGMASIGVRPTFHVAGQRTIEVHILEFMKDIYGSELRVDFLKRLRDELKYETADQLILQMNKDKELCYSLLHEFKL